jgi:2-keto-4-pentenoate hydratase/2-oxohepta-3-ene-1,7-dioic acid hydratase in catechol pathway
MKIICIGRNYEAHAKELGNDVPQKPIFFLKPDSAILPKRNPFYIPNFSQEIHYEVELIIKIKKLGKSIAIEYAKDYYSEIGLGIDFTARDLQQKCKTLGQPWEIAKAFDQSAVISEEFIKSSSLNQINFSLIKNGEIVQQANANEMIFDPNQIIHYVSKFMTLKIGDLIFTGTPKGVGPVKIGDKLEGFINEKKMFSVNIK